MKDKIERARQFAKQHSTAVLYTSGVATGIVMSAYIAHKHPRVLWRELVVYVNDTPEQLMENIQKSGGFAVYNPNTSQKIQIGVLPVLDKLDL